MTLLQLSSSISENISKQMQVSWLLIFSPNIYKFIYNYSSMLFNSCSFLHTSKVLILYLHLWYSWLAASIRLYLHTEASLPNSHYLGYWPTYLFIGIRIKTDFSRENLYILKSIHWILLYDPSFLFKVFKYLSPKCWGKARLSWHDTKTKVIPSTNLQTRSNHILGNNTFLPWQNVL